MDINPQWITLIFASNAMIASIAGAFVNTRVAKSQFNANVLSVNVTSVNDAPVGANGNATTTVTAANEDLFYTVQLADFGFTDPSDTPANGFAAVTINTLALNGGTAGHSGRRT